MEPPDLTPQDWLLPSCTRTNSAEEKQSPAKCYIARPIYVALDIPITYSWYHVYAPSTHSSTQPSETISSMGGAKTLCIHPPHQSNLCAGLPDAAAKVCLVRVLWHEHKIYKPGYRKVFVRFFLFSRPQTMDLATARGSTNLAVGKRSWYLLPWQKV